jgi:WD40 repeat protein/transcriptional regulator with XRE-family HTH domain
LVVTVETSFGRWLQRRRKALDLTQEELAQRVGCAAETLRKIEADVRRPSRQIAERLAEALEIPQADRAAFIKAARAELAVDRLAHPTQDIPQVTILPGKTLSSEAVTFLFTQITPAFQTKPFDGRCPYKGLDVFEEEDAELFFGRERLVEDLVRRMGDSRSVFIIGPSGSGKSSLVRAGLLHALKQGAVEDLNSERWLYETMTPGWDPIGELARVISSMAGTTNAGEELRAHASIDQDILARWCEIAVKEGRDKRVVLFVDQFEEIFTQVIPEEERLTFLNLLTHAATAKDGRVIVLFAMRSDFVLNCATYPKLNALFNQQSVQIGAMEPHELVSAIAQPALRVGLRIDPDLVAQIINDMQGEPGALPLMQFALKDLFDSQQAMGGMIDLNLKDYLEQGGIHKSLERHADGSFAKLSEGEQQLARSIFSGLIEIGLGTQDTRRTALLEELIPSDSKAADVNGVVQKLADARLITTDEQAGRDTVTISHEKLIDAWPWLKRLVDENREAIALQNEIATDAKEWDDHERDASYLYTGTKLANAREQLESKKIVLGGLSPVFIDSSQQAEETELRYEEQRRQKELDDARRLAEVEAKRAEIEKQRAEEQTYSATRLRQGRAYLIVALAVVLFLATMAGVFAVRNSGLAKTNASIAETAQAASTFAVAQEAVAQANAEEVQKQAKNARAGELAGQSVALRGRNLLVSSLLGIEAFNTRDTLQTRSVLIDNAQANPQLIAYLSKHRAAVDAVAFRPGGKMLASGGWDGTIILWDVETRQPIGERLSRHRDGVTSVAFHPDGKMLASGSYDKTIVLWDVETRQPIGQPLRGHTDAVMSVAFRPDGKMLASGSWDGTIILWDVETGQPIGQPLSGHTDAIYSVAFSPDGKMLASGSWDSTIILWDVETRQPTGHLLSEPVYSVAFSPDGKLLATGGQGNTITLWDVETKQLIAQLQNEPTEAIYSVVFSPDGKLLASGSWDDTIILWDMEARQPLGQPLSGHTDGVTSIAFSPDSRTLVSGSYDSQVILWDVGARQLIDRPLSGHTDIVSSVAFSPDGKILASGSFDGTTIVWDVATRQLVGQLRGENTDAIRSIAFSPDGRILASGSYDGTITLWDVETRQPMGQPLSGHTDVVFSVAFSPDGKILASGSPDASIILWDLERRQPIGPLFSEPVHSVAFSPDGKLLASGSFDSTVTLWDAERRQIIGKLPNRHRNAVISVTFSPDGKLLASGSYDGTMILWDVETRQPIGQPLSAHASAVFSVAFSPDGKILASGSNDSTIILWEVSSLLNRSIETEQPVGQQLTGYSGGVFSVAFSPDGKLLAAGTKDKTVVLRDVNVDPASWIQKTCQRVGRNLTAAEWVQYFPNEEYRTTCPQWR